VILNIKAKTKVATNQTAKKKLATTKICPRLNAPMRAEITLFPNVNLMSNVIESHIEEYMQKIKDSKNAEAEAERVQNDLITQVLMKENNALALPKNEEKKLEKLGVLIYCLFSPPCLIISGILAEALDIASLTTAINSSLTSSSTVTFNLPFFSGISLMKPPPEPA
jgi:hypothetical protein